MEIHETAGAQVVEKFIRVRADFRVKPQEFDRANKTILNLDTSIRTVKFQSRPDEAGRTVVEVNQCGRYGARTVKRNISIVLIEIQRAPLIPVPPLGMAIFFDVLSP